MIDFQKIGEHLERCAAIPNDSREWFDEVRALSVALAADPTFAGEPRGIAMRSGCQAWQPETAAQKLASVRRRRGSTEAALDWWRSVTNLGPVKAGAVKALTGVECAQPVNLSPTVALVPILHVPDSPNRMALFESFDNAIRAGLMGPTLPPRAALYRSGTAPAFCSAKPGGTDETDAWFEELDEAAKLLALVKRAVPVEAAQWLAFEGPDAAELAGTGLLRYPPEIEPHSFREPAVVTQLDVEDVVAQFQAMPENARAAISLALERLVRSRVLRAPGNRAIELAIVLEALLMQHEGRGNPYKLGQRAGRLLDSPYAERRRIAAVISAAYDLRSALVHGGHPKSTVKVAGEKISPFDLVTEVDDLCVRVVRRFLADGQMPMKSEQWGPIEFGPPDPRA